MRYSNQLLLIPIPILHHIFFSTMLAQPDFLCEQCRQPSYSKAYNNYTSNSAFANSLERLLSSITTNTSIDYGFYNFSVGQGFNRVNGIALCRGDITTTQCHSCLENAALKIRELCPNQREAIGWYDQCMLRYSNRDIFGFVEMEPYFNQTSIPFVTDGAKFNQTIEGLLEKLQNETAAGDTRLKFATGEAIVSDTHTMYALMQCTPDLEEFDCYNCLTGSIQYLQECCSLKDGARAVFPSMAGERRKIKIIIGSVVAIAVVFAVVVSLSCLRLKKHQWQIEVGERIGHRRHGRRQCG